MKRREALGLLAALLSGARPAVAAAQPPLVPMPKRYQPRAGAFELAGALPLPLEAVGTNSSGLTFIRADPQAGPDRPEAYRLVVAPSGVTLTSATPQGWSMGLRTLQQLALQRSIPCCEIVDWPDATLRAAHLCYHLVRETLPYNCPNFEGLLDQVDQMAALKYNAVLLELESMFPYQKHAAVSCQLAFTPEQISLLVERLHGHGMEIIPMVQCLGHAYNVLMHDAYAAYRETPDRTQQYCPTNPKVIDLYMEFVEEYLAVIPGVRRWHVGGDEGRQLGECPRCKAKVASAGTSALYVDHVTEVIGRLLTRGLTPLLWSDMLEQHPGEIARLPRETRIAYWNYDTAMWPRPYASTLFRDAGLSVIGAPGVRFGSPGTELSVSYPQALRGIETLIPRMVGEGCDKFIVTNWMKGSPHETTHYGFAYAADLCWNVGAARPDFQRRYASVEFGLEGREICDIYDLLSLKLPYAEPVQLHMPDKRERFDLTGLRFPEKWSLYTKADQEPEVLAQLQQGVVAATQARTALDELAAKCLRGHRQLEILRLSADCIHAKARFGLALHEGNRLTRAPHDRDSIAQWQALLPGIIAAWQQAKSRHHATLLVSGLPPAIDFLSELMFEPAELEHLEKLAGLVR